MNLKEYDWKIRYRSGIDNLLTAFYIPALERAVLYQRAAGYFSTECLIIAARGIVNLIRNNGKMRLVVSPNFSEEDIKIIESGYKQKEDILADVLNRQFVISEETLVQNRIEAISWMISENLLDIKIAIPKKNGKVTRGLYHEKVGIFTDEEGNFITFSGSSNESGGGYIYNFESFDVQRSWEKGLSEKLSEIKKREFEDLWSGKTANLEILNMPEAINEKILKMRPKSKPLIEAEEASPNRETVASVARKEIALPEHIQLRPHQLEASDKWFKNNNRGILQHATGSGKTITALNIAVNLLKKSSGVAIVILCPQKHIVDQWNKEARKFGFLPILGYQNSADWIDQLNHAILHHNMGILKNFMFITTNASFSMTKTQELLGKIKKDFLVIGDEVHNLGADSLRRCLVDNADCRLGLSATPERWYDKEGTNAIYEYFGGLLDPEYGIKEAIADGYLCRYVYHVNVVELTDEEADEYYEISQKISRIANFDKNEIENCGNDSLKILLSQRARLIGKAENKIKMLRAISKAYKDTTFNLFYCGDGKIEDERQIELVCKMLGLEIGMAVEKFTADEGKTERQDILSRFKKQKTQGLVAIKCLDEGVDVPDTQRAFILASSSNPRQFIQRRGRVLRSTANKNKIAEIFDFIVVPPDVKNAKKRDATLFNIERRLVRRELMRFVEFAETAENEIEARGKLLELKKIYNLLDI
jgi:superfamily II DNA or RNA helicase